MLAERTKEDLWVDFTREYARLHDIPYTTERERVGRATFIVREMLTSLTENYNEIHKSPVHQLESHDFLFNLPYKDPETITYLYWGEKREETPAERELVEKYNHLRFKRFRRGYPKEILKLDTFHIPVTVREDSVSVSFNHLPDYSGPFSPYRTEFLNLTSFLGNPSILNPILVMAAENPFRQIQTLIKTANGYETFYPEHPFLNPIS